MLKGLHSITTARSIKTMTIRRGLSNCKPFPYQCRLPVISCTPSLNRQRSPSAFAPVQNVIPKPRRFFSEFLRYCGRLQGFTEDEESMTLKFSDDSIARFHHFWLRDHCHCDECYHPITYQRMIDTQKIPLDIKPKHVSIVENEIKIEWLDGHNSCFSTEWLYENQYGQPYHCYDIKDIKKHLWNAEEFKGVQDSNFKEILEDDSKLLEFLEKLVKYGIAFIGGVEEPYTDSLTKLASRTGLIQNTHYGDVWVFTSGEVHYADTAYLPVKLESHTDGTYFYESPGLQLLHCNFHTGEGGENVFVDGFYVAEQLKKQDPDAFEFLARTKIPSIYYEKDSYVFKAFDSVIKRDEFDNQIYQIRFNSSDRDTLSCLSFEDVEKFYKASHSFTSLIRQAANELVVKPKPGRAALFDNWRVFHARNTFTGKRQMAGFYMQRNTFLSKILSLREKLSK